jgi:hypothetical protein
MSLSWPKNKTRTRIIYILPWWRAQREFEEWSVELAIGEWRVTDRALKCVVTTSAAATFAEKAGGSCKGKSFGRWK